MGKQTLRIALLWHTVGHGNLGVDALARSHATLLRQAAARAGRDVHFTTIGSGQNHSALDLPYDLTVGPSPRLKPLLYGRSPFVAAIKSSDVVFDIGQGDSFTDIYGLKRFLFQLGSKLIVLMYGKPLILAPQTIGPFEQTWTRKLALRVMQRAQAVHTRDQLSTSFLSQIGLTENVQETIDVAFALPYQTQASYSEKFRLGINVSGLLYNGGYSGKNELGLTIDYRDLNERIIAAALDRGLEVNLFSHVRGSGRDNDLAVMSHLKARYPDVCCAPPFESAESAKSYMSGLDFVISGRMHACIGAFSAGIPVVPIAYSRKFNGLFNTLGYRHYVDGKALATKAALDKVLWGLDNAEILRADVERGMVIAKGRLDQYRDYLDVVMQNAPCQYSVQVSDRSLAIGEKIKPRAFPLPF